MPIRVGGCGNFVAMGPYFVEPRIHAAVLNSARGVVRFYECTSSKVGRSLASWLRGMILRIEPNMVAHSSGSVAPHHSPTNANCSSPTLDYLNLHVFAHHDITG